MPADRTVVFSPFGLGVLDLAVGKYVYDQVPARGELHVVDDFFHDLRRHGWEPHRAVADDANRLEWSVTGRTTTGRWLQYDYGSAYDPRAAGPFTMWRYRNLMPVPDGPVRYPVPVGGTPLLPAPALQAGVGRTPRLWIKDETREPDGIEQGPRHRTGDRGRACGAGSPPSRPPRPATPRCPRLSAPQRPGYGRSSSCPLTVSRASSP